MPVTRRVEVPLEGDEPDVVAALLWAAGALGTWERPGDLVAWFATERPEDVVVLPEPLAGRARWLDEPDRDWQQEWKATIRPVRAGRTAVVPSWLADGHRPVPDELTIVLDPGRAFGSGHHATTCLCLELLDELDLRGDLAGRTLADVGCGSGILAIAAAARGARATGVDVDETALDVTQENARRNGVEVTTAHGSVDVLPGPADVVVANLVTDLIAALAVPLVAATRAHLIASGIGEQRQPVAIGALEAAGLTVDEVRARDGWVAVLGHPARDADEARR